MGKWNLFTLLSDFPYLLDIDECSTNNLCDADAICINTIGSYTCACAPGFYGDGSSCSGMHNVQKIKLKKICRIKYITLYYIDESV